MADYKALFNSIVGKVKDATEGVTVKDIYTQGATRARSYGQIAKLTLDLNRENDELKKVYAEIGRLYYEQCMNDPQGFFQPLFAQAKIHTERIRRMQDEIDAAKQEAADSSVRAQRDFGRTVDESVDDIEVEICEFDDIVDSSAADTKDE